MPDPFERISRLWLELKRRNVVRRNTVYAATAFVILELVSIIQEPLNLPEWTLRIVIILLSIGFVVSIIISWIFQTGPEGELVKTRPVSGQAETDTTSSSTGWKVASYISFGIIILLIVLNVFPRDRSIGLSDDSERSIAVLPLENMSSDNDHAYFGDALTDEIIMQLYKINEFSVRSRTSVMAYKNSNKTMPDIGKELDVNYLIEGSAQRFEDQVRIRVQLIRASSDDPLWGETFEGDWSDILSVQSRIAKEVAQELKIVLTSKEIEEIERVPTQNPEAYEFYLRAHYFQNTRSEEGFAKAVIYYEKALELDSTFAGAYSGLSYCIVLQGIYGHVPMPEAHPRAAEAVGKALRLNPDLGEAHAALAIVKLVESDFEGSAGAYQKSINLNPEIANSHHGYSYILAYLGNTSEAVQAAQEALRLEPMNPNMIRGLGYTYYHDRQFERAIEFYNRCLELDSSQTSAYEWSAWAYHALQDQSSAIASLAGLLNVLGHPDLAQQISVTFKESGYREAIRKTLDITEHNHIPYISGPYWGSLFHALIGDRDESIRYMKEYVSSPYTWRISHPKYYPFFDSISQDPRMEEIMELKSEHVFRSQELFTQK